MTLGYSLDDIEQVLPPAPAKTRASGFVPPDQVKQGDRHDTIYKAIRSQRLRGFSFGPARAAALVMNSEFTEPIPVDEEFEKFMKRAYEKADSRPAEWRRLLRGSITQGRTVLQRLLIGRIVFTPRPNGVGYDFSAQTRFDRLFAGIVVPRPAHIREGDVRGTEQVCSEDTFRWRLRPLAGTGLGG